MEHLHSRFRCIIFDSYLIYLFLVWTNDVGTKDRNIELFHSNCPHLHLDIWLVTTLC